MYKRPRVLPIQKTDMEPLPMKPKPVVPAKGTATRKRRSSSSTAKSKTKRPVKPSPKQQPRDTLGRFARKTGQVLWAGVKATGRAVVGTAKGIKKVHKTVKRSRAGYRQRANLELRERRLALAEREKKLGLRKKKVVRRKRA